jgi:hypothetical protein
MAATSVLEADVERRVGSSPTLGTNSWGFSSLVEQLNFKQVIGSNPITSTNFRSTSGFVLKC